MDDGAARALLQQAFAAAVARVSGGAAVLRHLPDPPAGRCVVVGVGKSAAAMAAAVDAAWPDVDISGVVVTAHGHGVPAGRIAVVEAGHPVPDDASHAAGQLLSAAVAGLGADDLVLALISGGGSANAVAPIAGLTLDDKQAINRALLASGARIEDMNMVRRHLSRLKGGRLALAAAPARIVSLVISDIPGDCLSAVASGPTLADLTTPRDALAIIDAQGIAIPDPVRATLAAGTAPVPMAQRHEAILIASPRQALEAAAQVARDHGVTPMILGDAIEGESREVARVHAGIARSVAQTGTPLRPPAMLISGGETTVTLGGVTPGRGGRNTEFALSLAVALDGVQGIWALAADSDGIDGTERAAGACVAPDTLQRIAAGGMNAAAALRGHDSYSIFAALDDLIVTGPTLTNVNDIRLILIA